MGLREDVKYIINKDFEPKVPSREEILKQAENQIKRGKSTGNIALDREVIKRLRDDGEEK